MTGTVLAIDDSPEVLAALVARLKPEGHRVLTAIECQAGVELAVLHTPDIILLDVCMPEQSGLDVCRRLKHDPRTAHIPIVFLTASDDVRTKVHGFDLGASDYITKPFHPDELRARVRTILRTKQERDGLHKRARLDGLTQLDNRASFDEAIARALGEAASSDGDVSLLILDLDHFKKVNDSHGHLFGDHVLQRVGALLVEAAGTQGLACRYGGEELALILPGMGLSAAAEIAEDLRARLAGTEFRPGATTIAVTSSIGVSSRRSLLGTRGEVDVPLLVGAADKALYRAKRDGRDCVRTVLDAERDRQRSRATTGTPTLMPSLREERTPSVLPSALPQAS